MRTEPYTHTQAHTQAHEHTHIRENTRTHRHTDTQANAQGQNSTLTTCAVGTYTRKFCSVRDVCFGKLKQSALDAQSMGRVEQTSRLNCQESEGLGPGLQSSSRSNHQGNWGRFEGRRRSSDLPKKCRRSFRRCSDCPKASKCQNQRRIRSVGNTWHRTKRAHRCVSTRDTTAARA